MKNSQQKEKKSQTKMRVKIIHSGGKNWIECYFYPMQNGTFEEGYLWEEIILGKKK